MSSRNLKLQPGHEEGQGESQADRNRKGLGCDEKANGLNHVGSASIDPFPIIGIPEHQAERESDKNPYRDISKHVHNFEWAFWGVLHL